MKQSTSPLPCLLYEDEHLLVVNKPAGLNTHSPSPFAGEGIYDWLKHREPRWARLAIIHRLDKETSGVIVFSKTALANRSLTEQFAQRQVRKKYLLLTDRPVQRRALVVTSKMIRAGERYVSSERGEPAETRFNLLGPAFRNPVSALVEAEPVTGRTHQIRVHAADSGFPILGDTLYSGTPAGRVFLHAHSLSLRHPASDEQKTFTAPTDFFVDARLALRSTLIDSAETNAFRLIHGASDGWPGWYVDRFGDFLLSQSERPLSRQQGCALGCFTYRGVYHKLVRRSVRQSHESDASPELVIVRPPTDEDQQGETPREVIVRENDLKFSIRFDEGCSVGLFLDQRDNRRRFLTGHIAADFELRVPHSEFRVLNTFAYTCGFSVCAAKAGAHTTSLDLSKRYLDCGRRNFELSGLDPAAHEFIHGDVFDWLRRLAKKGRGFDAIVLDPPTFSRSKEHGTFQVERDFGKLVTAAMPLLKPDGVLFASTNCATLKPEKFLEMIGASVKSAGRKIQQQHYVPQPPDFPISREEPAYLKTVWLRL